MTHESIVSALDITKVERMSTKQHMRIDSNLVCERSLRKKQSFKVIVIMSNVAFDLSRPLKSAYPSSSSPLRNDRYVCY